MPLYVCRTLFRFTKKKTKKKSGNRLLVYAIIMCFARAKVKLSHENLMKSGET